MNEHSVYSRLTEIFHDVFNRNDIVLNSKTAAKDVDGWDSFKQIEIVLSIEEFYHIKFTTRELDSLQNVGDLVRVIVARAAA